MVVPLIRLEAPKADEATQQAILYETAEPNADWHYWVNRGYEFS